MNEKPKKITIERLYEGKYASLRSNSVRKAFLEGRDVVVHYQGEVMTLKRDILPLGRRGKEWFTSKFPPYEQYCLMDYKWKPDRIQAIQESLFNNL